MTVRYYFNIRDQHWANFYRYGCKKLEINERGNNNAVLHLLLPLLKEYNGTYVWPGGETWRQYIIALEFESDEDMIIFKLRF